MKEYIVNPKKKYSILYNYKKYKPGDSVEMSKKKAGDYMDGILIEVEEENEQDSNDGHSVSPEIES